MRVSGWHSTSGCVAGVAALKRSTRSSGPSDVLMLVQRALASGALMQSVRANGWADIYVDR